jgi:hypothetical protein
MFLALRAAPAGFVYVSPVTNYTYIYNTTMTDQKTAHKMCNTQGAHLVAYQVGHPSQHCNLSTAAAELNACWEHGYHSPCCACASACGSAWTRALTRDDLCC